MWSSGTCKARMLDTRVLCWAQLSNFIVEHECLPCALPYLSRFLSWYISGPFTVSDVLFYYHEIDEKKMRLTFAINVWHWQEFQMFCASVALDSFECGLLSMSQIFTIAWWGAPLTVKANQKHTLHCSPSVLLSQPSQHLFFQFPVSGKGEILHKFSILSLHNSEHWIQIGLI